MTKIIFFDDSVTIFPGQNLINSPQHVQQCMCINWNVDGLYQNWVGIPDNYEIRMDSDGNMHIAKKKED